MPTDAAGRAFLAQKAQEPGVISRPSGLLYKYIERGTGTGHPLPDTPCDFHYRGNLIDGKEFDSSFKRGKPSEFTANGVVPGCSEGYQLMVEGDKVMFYIPSELAYGDQGVGGDLVPPGAVLVFEVHLVRIKGPTKPAAGQAATQPQFAQPPAYKIQPQAYTTQPQAYTTQAIVQPQAYTTQPQTFAAQSFAQPQSLAYGQAQAVVQPQASVYAQQAYAEPVQYVQTQTMAPAQYASAQTIAQPMAYTQTQTSVQPLVTPTPASQPAVMYAAPAKAAKTYTSQPAVAYAAPVAAPAAVVSQPTVAGYVSQAQVAPAAQTVVTSVVGDWQICQDNLGEFYYHTPSATSFDQAPAELLQLLGTQQVTQSVVGGQQTGVSYVQPQAAKQVAQYVIGGQQAGASYVQPQAAAVVTQASSYLGPPPVAAQAAPAEVKSVVGDWMICQDDLGEFYSHAPTGQSFDQPPPELLQLLGMVR